MIKKTYLTVLSIAIVSVLLGSLLYSNITQAQKGKEPSIYKDVVSINLLNVDSCGFQTEAVIFGAEYAWVHNIPFVFSPKGTVHNITNLWCSFIGIAGNGITIEISLNNVYITSYSFIGGGCSVYNSFQVIDTNIYDAFKPNQINLLTLTHTPVIGSNSVFLQEFTFFIEYEYQAR